MKANVSDYLSWMHRNGTFAVGVTGKAEMRFQDGSTTQKSRLVILMVRCG